jgi:signal transduction histidine kinase
MVCLIYLPAVITLILFPLIGYANGQPIIWFRSVRMLGYGAGFLGAAGVALFNYFKAISPRTKQQMKIVLVSCLMALIPFLFLGLLPSALWTRPIIPPDYSILLVIFIPLGMGYAVVTKQLMDIDVIMRRSLIYGLVTIVMAAILSAGIFIAFAFRRTMGVPEEILIALILGGIATALFGPTKKGVENLIDRLFYKDRYDYKQIIQSLGISLNSAIGLTAVSRLVVGTVVNTLNLAGGCLFVRTQSGSFEVGAAQGSYIDPAQQRQLLELIPKRSRLVEFPNNAPSESPDAAFLVPLVVGEKEVGVLCLSRKKTRQDFSPDDLYLIQGIASAASMALHSVMLKRDVSIRATFVSVASHELRTPLTSIVGYADLLLQRDPPAATRKQWLKNILDNSQRVSDMVDDLLNVSRIQSGKTSIKLERVSLPGPLEETLSLSRETTNKHEFVVDIEPGLPYLSVDRNKFGEIIGNLLSNAIKYSPNGGLITLSARSEPAEHRVIVSVSDEGIGIAPEDRASLFTSFHRIQRPETKGIRGSGLGLYIAKEWTEAMGGNIWVESELNKGSTFFVAVPAKASSKVGQESRLPAE